MGPCTFPRPVAGKTVPNRVTEFARSKFFHLMTFPYFLPYWKGLNDICEHFKDTNGDYEQDYFCFKYYVKSFSKLISR